MVSLLENPPSPTQPVMVLFRILFFFMVLVSTASPENSSTTASPENSSAANALLKWKASLHDYQNLSSWIGSDDPCSWNGIVCNAGGSICELNLPRSGLIGTLHDLDFSFFPNLVTLDLRHNSIYGAIPWRQITKISSLSFLDLSANHLTGTIPLEIGRLSSLKVISLSRNHISSRIPVVIGNLRNLTILRLSDNHFYGTMPQELGNLTRLTELDLAKNILRGSAPVTIGFLSLKVLCLNNNKLSGPISKTIENMTELRVLYLHENQFTENLSEDFGIYPDLEDINLSYNEFYGELSWKWGQCHNLSSLNISNNNISGWIPPELGNLHSLQTLDLSKNLLTGEIPQQLGELRILEMLNLSHNNLSGSIPSSFEQMFKLISVDVSYNQLEGPLPNNKAFQETPILAFSNNKGLCGNSSGLKDCLSIHPNRKRDNKVMIFIVVTVLCSILLVLIIFGVGRDIRFVARNRINKSREAEEQNRLSIGSDEGEILYENITDATEGFNSTYRIGVGGFGSTYKACMPMGRILAVKKLHPLTDSSIASLEASTSAILAFRHPNIIRLHGFFSHPQHSLLVYDFLEGGVSLGKMLSNEEKATSFDWIKRVNVVKVVAKALFSMHHDNRPPLIHQHLSSNNVLLDCKYEAHISDTGQGRLSMLNSPNQIHFAGTFGYTAPELTKPIEADEKCDVYSFGVVALEVIRGGHPGDVISSLSYPTSFSTSIAHHVPFKDVLDQRLSQPEDQVAEEVISVARIAFSCLHTNPQSRPTMLRVCTELSAAKRPWEKPFPTITLEDLVDLKEFRPLFSSHAAPIEPPRLHRHNPPSPRPLQGNRALNFIRHFLPNCSTPENTEVYKDE